MIDKLAIIGVGLIGSSLSLALKQAGAVNQVIGFGRNQQNLAKGIELGDEAICNRTHCRKRRGSVSIEDFDVGSAARARP